MTIIFKIAFLSLFFQELISPSLAQNEHPFSVERFESSNSRSWTMEEFLLKIGENSKYLPSYLCNERDELDPFYPGPRTNPLKNSLRIKSNTSEEVYTYIEGTFYTSAGRVVQPSDLFTRHMVKALRSLESLQSTSKLLRLLESAPFVITMNLGSGSFYPREENSSKNFGINMAQAISIIGTKKMDGDIPFYDIGAGGALFWHPNIFHEMIEDDDIMRKADPLVTLAHEMYHAFDSVRGLLNLGFVKGDHYEFDLVSEYRAVYFENLVRKELGLKYRKYYGSITEGPDMLNDENQPIYIPAPCLDSLD